MMEKLIKTLNRILETIVVALMTIIVMVVFSQIIARYFLNKPLSWSEELSRLCFTWLVFLGVPLVTYSNTHIRVDYFVYHLPSKLKNTVCLFVDILLALFFVTIFLYGLSFIHSQLGMRSVSLNIPMVCFSWAVTIGMFFETIYILYDIFTGNYKNVSEV